MKQTKAARDRRARERERREAREVHRAVGELRAAADELAAVQERHQAALLALSGMPVRQLADLAGISKSEVHRRITPQSHAPGPYRGQMTLEHEAGTAAD